MSQPIEQTCPGCGRTNGCAIAAGRAAAACWCMESTPRLPLPEDRASCFCERCLQLAAVRPRDDAGAADAH